jgi:hypothetical protein
MKRRSYPKTTPRPNNPGNALRKIHRTAYARAKLLKLLEVGEIGRWFGVRIVSDNEAWQ